MAGYPLLSGSSLRKVFWIAWPVLTLAGLLVVVWQALSLIGYEGQFANHVIPGSFTAIMDGTQPGQTFVAPRAGLERVEVLMYARPRNDDPQPVTFHLRRVGQDQDIVSQTFGSGEVRGWQWRRFRFTPILDSAGQGFYFFFDSSASRPEDAIRIGGVEGDLYPDGNASINEHPVFGDVAFKTYYANISLTEKLSALGAKLTEHKPSIWGDIRFYVLLALLYLLLAVGLGWQLCRLGTTQEKPVGQSERCD